MISHDEAVALAYHMHRPHSLIYDFAGLKQSFINFGSYCREEDSKTVKE